MRNKKDTLNEIKRRRVSAIIRADDAGVAAEAMKAAVAGGFRVVEFTLTTPNALDLISEFAEQPDLLVGAGTVLETRQARDAVSAGAKFLVSPVCDPDIIGEANALGVVSVPGTFTATEMLSAHRAGADLVKLFPAPSDVARHVASILGPMPFLNIFPTAGVDADNFVEVLRAGAAGVGFVKSLFDPRELAEKDFQAIERRASSIISRLEAYQEQ